MTRFDVRTQSDLYPERLGRNPIGAHRQQRAYCMQQKGVAGLTERRLLPHRGRQTCKNCRCPAIYSCRREAASFLPLAFPLNEACRMDVGSGGGNVRLRIFGRPNGLEVNPRGRGPRGYGSAARRMPAFETRDAGGVTPCKLR